MPGLASAALSVLAEVTFADAPDPEPAFRLAERWIGMAQRDGNRGRELGGLCSLHGMRVESGRRAGLTEIEARVAELNDGRFAFGEMSFACKRALAIAIDGDFATAHDLLAGLSMDQLAPAHRGAWLASLALFAAGAGRRAAACGAIDSGLACITDSLAVKPVWQAQSAVFLAAAALVVKRDAIANRVLLALESESRIVPQPARAFVRAVRAMYLCIQTGRGNDTQVRDALEELGRMGRGGLASLLRNLPLPERGEKLALAALTRTELKVLDALARGGTSKSVAAELGRSSQTIDTHVKSIVHKLGCAGRREAIALARAHGLGALGPSNLPRSSV
jgi:DNA-binding NarL/FixJ family response regulator